jgi:hypothetical protein
VTLAATLVALAISPLMLVRQVPGGGDPTAVMSDAAAKVDPRAGVGLHTQGALVTGPPEGDEAGGFGRGRHRQSTIEAVSVAGVEGEFVGQGHRFISTRIDENVMGDRINQAAVG